MPTLTIHDQVTGEDKSVTIPAGSHPTDADIEEIDAVLFPRTNIGKTQPILDSSRFDPVMQARFERYYFDGTLRKDTHRAAMSREMLARGVIRIPASPSPRPTAPSTHFDGFVKLKDNASGQIYKIGYNGAPPTHEELVDIAGKLPPSSPSIVVSPKPIPAPVVTPLPYIADSSVVTAVPTTQSSATGDYPYLIGMTVFLLILLTVVMRKMRVRLKLKEKVSPELEKPDYILNQPQRITLWVGVIILSIVMLFPPCIEWPKFVSFWSYNEMRNTYWAEVRPMMIVIFVLTAAGMASFAQRRLSKP